MSIPTLIAVDSETFNRLVESVERLREKLEARLDEIAAPPPEFYTVAQFAEITGWSAETIRDWCNAGEITADYSKKRREKWMIPAGELKRVKRKRIVRAQ